MKANYQWLFDKSNNPCGWQTTGAPVDNVTVFDYPCEVPQYVESREEKVRREVNAQLAKILLESASFAEVKQKIADIDASVKAAR